MPEMPIVPPNYDDVADEQIFWLPPEMVIGVTDSDGNVIAYGIKIDPDELEIEEEGTPEGHKSGDDTPLPQPTHLVSDSSGICLGCEWAILRDRIKRAAENGS